MESTVNETAYSHGNLKSSCTKWETRGWELTEGSPIYTLCIKCWKDSVPFPYLKK